VIAKRQDLEFRPRAAPVRVRVDFALKRSRRGHHTDRQRMKVSYWRWREGLRLDSKRVPDSVLENGISCAPAQELNG
jgi:hypothetical protein